MATINQPNILPSAFAENGDKNNIPATNNGGSGLASWNLGFPPITAQPLSQGGVPPQRNDFNGILNQMSKFLMFIQNGGVFAYNTSFDYQPPAIVWGNNNYYKCVATNGPNTSHGVQSLTNRNYWVALGDPLSNYPVGSIYMSVNSTSPQTLFGGTWEAMPAGRVLLAQGQSSWGQKYNAGSTGGEYQHTLSVGEMPSHNHSARTNTTGWHNHGVQTWNTESVGGNAVSSYATATKTDYIYVDGNGNHSHTVTINNTGSNQSHNNMQPYLAVYMWKRIA